MPASARQLGQTALHCAAGYGAKESVALLLAKGAKMMEDMVIPLAHRPAPPSNDAPASSRRRAKPHFHSPRTTNKRRLSRCSRRREALCFHSSLCPLTVETYEEVSSLRKELPNEVKRLLFYRLSKRMKCLVETG